MKCAYCGKPCGGIPGNEDYSKYDAEINNMDVTVTIHNKCLLKVMGEWIMNRLQPSTYTTFPPGNFHIKTLLNDCFEEDADRIKYNDKEIKESE